MHNVFVNQRALRPPRCPQRFARRRSGRGRGLAAAGAGAQFARVELIELMQQVGAPASDQREVLLLAAVEELRYEEIAAVLAMPAAP